MQEKLEGLDGWGDNIVKDFFYNPDHPAHLVEAMDVKHTLCDLVVRDSQRKGRKRGVRDTAVKYQKSFCFYPRDVTAFMALPWSTSDMDVMGEGYIDIPMVLGDLNDKVFEPYYNNVTAHVKDFMKAYSVDDSRIIWDGRGCIVLQVYDFLKDQRTDKSNASNMAAIGALETARVIFDNHPSKFTLQDRFGVSIPNPNSTRFHSSSSDLTLYQAYLGLETEGNVFQPYVLPDQDLPCDFRSHEDKRYKERPLLFTAGQDYTLNIYLAPEGAPIHQGTLVSAPFFKKLSTRHLACLFEPGETVVQCHVRFVLDRGPLRMTLYRTGKKQIHTIRLVLVECTPIYFALSGEIEKNMEVRFDGTVDDDYIHEARTRFVLDMDYKSGAQEGDPDEHKMEKNDEDVQVTDRSDSDE